MFTLKGKLEISDFYQVVFNKEQITIDKSVTELVEESFNFLKSFSENKVIL